jgi:NADH-quinone oxidoreductase subunit L
MFRLLYLTFFGEGRYDKHTADHLHESPKVMTMPLVILAVLSIGGGWVGIPHVLGGGAWFEKFLEPVMAHSHNAAGQEAHHDATIEYLLMGVTIVLVLISIYLAYYLYRKNIDKVTAIKQSVEGLWQLIYNKYYVDEFYGATVVRPIINGSIFLWKIIDVFLIDGIANGLAWLVGDMSETFRRMQGGYVRTYMTVFVVGAVVLIGYLVVR